MIRRCRPLRAGWIVAIWGCFLFGSGAGGYGEADGSAPLDASDHRAVGGAASRFGIADQARSGLVEVLDRESGERICFGTVVGGDGSVLTKASEIEDRERVFVRELGSETAFEETWRAVDRENDVALLRCDGLEAEPVRWAGDTEELEIGKVVLTVTAERSAPRPGVIAAKSRAIKKAAAVIGVIMSEKDDPDREGVRIAEVADGGPAASAGVAAGEILETVAGQEVRSDLDVIRAVSSLDPGEVIELGVRKGDSGDSRVVSVTLGYRSQVFADLRDRNEQMSGAMSKRKSGFRRVIQHDIGLQPEEVGGPLINLHGEAVGINIARVDRVTTFALPAELAQEIARDLMD